MGTLFEQFSGPCYLVNFSQYYTNLDCGKYKYQVACCEECKLSQLDNLMKNREYFPLDISQAPIYGKTRMEVKLVGRYQIEGGSLALT